MLLNRARTHPRIAGYLFVGSKARLLSLRRLADSFPDCRRCFLRAFTRNLAIFNRWDFNVEIDPVEERTRDALAITLDLGGTATAFAFQIAKVAAGTWLRCPFVVCS